MTSAKYVQFLGDPTILYRMNAIYSVATAGKTKLDRWNTNAEAVALMKLSVAEAKKHFDKVFLHTDAVGKKLFEQIEFEEVYLSLEGFDVPSTLATACKLNTVAIQTGPFVHLDWDFILWRLLDRSKLSPVVAQCATPAQDLAKWQKLLRALEWKPKFLEAAIEAHEQIDLPCPGVLGGDNHLFLSRYASLALEILRHPGNAILRQPANQAEADDICIFVEQVLLALCAREEGVQIHYLTQEPTYSLNAVDPRWLPKLGFTHLSGGSKRDPLWKNIVARLSKARPEAYDQSNLAQREAETEPFDLRLVRHHYLVSMEAQTARRGNALRLLKELGCEVEWKTPIKISEVPWDQTPEIYRYAPKYASQVWTLMAIFDEVEKAGVDRFALFEDDIVLHPQITELLPRIRIPTCWKFIYLGGRNGGYRYNVATGMVRSTFVSDLHAVVIKADIIPDLRQVLLDGSICSHWADFRIATLHWQHPAYLCRPNLFWQSFHQNDSGTGEGYSNYNADGSVAYAQGD